jgi:glycerophosphoryl diester phosphodiesterase
LSGGLVKNHQLVWLIKRPIAHRGLHDRAQNVVENTYSAFARAMAGDYAIECDLQLSGDGEAMVFHDHDLDRLTVETGPVAARTCDELKTIDLRDSSDRMQALQDMLDQVDGQVPLIIEMKSLWNGDMTLARRTCELVADYDGPAAVMSFDPKLMLYVRDHHPNLPRGLVRGLFLKRNWPELDEDKLKSLRLTRNMDDVDPHFLSAGLEALDSDWCVAYRKTGRPVICWTVRSRQIAARSLQYCDQITFEGFDA